MRNTYDTVHLRQENTLKGLSGDKNRSCNRTNEKEIELKIQRLKYETMEALRISLSPQSRKKRQYHFVCFLLPLMLSPGRHGGPGAVNS